MAFCPEQSKLDQNPRFTPLTLICESSRPPSPIPNMRPLIQNSQLGKHMWILSLNYNLSQAFSAGLSSTWAEFNFAGKLAVVDDGNFLCQHQLRRKRTPLRRFDPYLQVKWLKIVPIRFAFRTNLSTSAIHRRHTGPPLYWNHENAARWQLQPATTSQIGWP